MSTINLICRTCSSNFLYAKKEFNRQTKIGRNKDQFYCSSSCARVWKNKNRPQNEKDKIRKTQSERCKGNMYAKKGNFTTYLNKARNRLKEYDLDEEYLDSIWNGKCAITGIDIQLKQGKSNLLTASLDRIDSSKGYVKGNVQFVCYGINLAKNSFTDKDVLEFVRQIRAS